MIIMTVINIVVIIINIGLLVIIVVIQYSLPRPLSVLYFVMAMPKYVTYLDK
jgi:hypothetical protein